MVRFRLFTIIVAVIGINLQTCWTAIDQKGAVDQSGGMGQGIHINQKSSKGYSEHGGDLIQKTSINAADQEVTMRQEVQLDAMDPSSGMNKNNATYITGFKDNGAAMSQLELKDKSLKMIRRSNLIYHQNTLKDLSLVDLPQLEELADDCFTEFPLFRSLYIWNVPNLQKLPKNILRPAPPEMRSIRILYSGLREPPDLGALADSGLLLHIVDLEGNKLQKLPTRGLRVRADQLILDDNDIMEIEDFAFEGSELAELSLRGNKRLSLLREHSFDGLIGIRELDLSSTSILFLPVLGLSTLEVLRVENNIHMKTIPSIYDFKHLRQAWLTHHFHCCAFHFPELHDPKRHAQYQAYLTKIKQLCSRNQSPAGRRRRAASATLPPPAIPPAPDTGTAGRADTRTLSDPGDGLMVSYDLGAGVYGSWGELSLEPGAEWNGEDMEGVEYPEEEHEDWKADNDFGVFHHSAVPPPTFQIAICGNLTQRADPVQCWPRADALNPCSGVLGSRGPRALGWLVGLVGASANLLVAVALAARAPSAPARLLHLQLALTDLCTALYLLLLAAVDTYTADSYFNYAYDWQYGIGCKVAGFLGVVGAQGSLLALAALTLERWLAITRALHPNSRLSPRAARALLAAGLLYSALAALLPLVGVSDYSSTSVCLPMRQKGVLDSVYLWGLLLGGALSVVAVASCYLHIYSTLARDSRHCAARKGEASVANKMAILIAIHMACVVPVGAAGAGALAGRPLVQVAGAKLLLVLVYPLNALADPFLYAILTHQFRKDLCLLLSRYGLCTQRAQQYKVPGTNLGPLLSGGGPQGGHREGAQGASGRGRPPAGSLTTAYEELPV